MFSGRRSPWPAWVDRQLVQRGITDERVLRVFCEVSRVPFVPPSRVDMAEVDAPIPIGCGQTVSQPYIIALSLQALNLRGSERVLDVGTGSGFQAVLLSRLAAEVFTIEFYQELYLSARLVIERLRRGPVHTRHGDGSQGWPEEAPFDAIVVGARAPSVPDSLVAQLVPGGTLVIPVGGDYGQYLYRIHKTSTGELEKSMLEGVMFVPLRGKEGIDRRGRG